MHWKWNYVANCFSAIYVLIKNQTFLSKNLQSLTSLCNFPYCFALFSTFGLLVPWLESIKMQGSQTKNLTALWQMHPWCFAAGVRCIHDVLHPWCFFCFLYQIHVQYAFLMSDSTLIFIYLFQIHPLVFRQVSDIFIKKIISSMRLLSRSPIILRA